MSRILMAGGLAISAAMAMAAGDIGSLALTDSDFKTAHEAVQESIESEGLTISRVIPFGEMLERTARDVGETESPYLHAEIVQFCSSKLAWRLIREDSSQIALCPMSIAIYEMRGNPARLFLSWRLPEQSSGTRQDSKALIERVVAHAEKLARLH